VQTVQQPTSTHSPTRDGADATVLVVDDDPAIRRVFCSALRRAKYHTLEAANGQAALDLLADNDVDVALLDLEMPGLSGIELVARVRSDPRHESMGIVLVSGDGALDSKLAGLEAGANDYLVKPVELQELLARVAAQLRDRSRWLARLDQQLAARSRMARRIADLDPSLPLGLLERRLQEILSAELSLTELRLRPPDPDIIGATQLTVTTEEDMSHVRVPLRFAGSLVGVVDATVDAHAERAVSALGDLAPQLGAVLGDRSRDDGRAADARAWLDGLLANDDLAPVYQPIVTLPDRAVVGYEGLSRFADGTPPDVAFARAAEGGVGLQLELAALERPLTGAGDLPPNAWLSFNVSAATLLSGQIDDLVLSANRPLIVEVTENEYVEDYQAVRDRLAALPGVRLAVDDAGAGYASLRHVFELRPDLIKLDRSWMARIDEDPVRQALVTGLIGFCAALDARIVAEGVEREEEAAILRTLGVPLAQGYLFGRPAPCDQG
jgi:EAL domain-containing protein (putative c-di-GMP-specific phosphodiesterase class I)/DNA-binding response OmpR family regulator